MLTLTTPSLTAALSTPATPSAVAAPPRAAAPSTAAAPSAVTAPSATAAPLPSFLRIPPSFLRRQESKRSTALKVSPHPGGRFRGGIAAPPHTRRSSVGAPRSVIPARPLVIPAQAGIQANRRHSFAPRTHNGPQTPRRVAVGAPKTLRNHEIAWIPAYAGMTEGRAGTTERCAGVTEGYVGTAGPIDSSPRSGSLTSNSPERVTRRSRYVQYA